MKINKSVRLFTEKHLENIGSMFKTMYNDELLTDCTLHCKDGSLRAHKAILAASSSYFRKVFLEHKDDRAIFIMHGVSLEQLKDLLELIYKGAIDVSSDTLNRVYDLAEELELTGVLYEEGSLHDTNSNAHGRDTRFKGQKRVAVDFTPEEMVPEKIIKCSAETRISSSSEKATVSVPIKSETNITETDDDTAIEDEEEKTENIIARKDISNQERVMGHSVDEQSTLSVWARKERKFKCDLCPSSFKRASHLTRHQLVHTGERPYACSQCEKAFSRHDKLKHHIHKAHELPSMNESLPPDSLYTIRDVHILSPEQTMFESPEPVVSSPPRPQSPTPAPPCPQKKGRGRPRKYPPVPPPLVKRPRGRPRLNPIVPPEPPAKQENYDISNMPYGDIEYLTKPLEETNEELSIEHHELMEPLVEIKTDAGGDKTESDKEEKPAPTFLENIGLFENTAVAKIGECTISVANNSNATT